MKTAEFRKIRAIHRTCQGWAWAAWKLAIAGRSALLLGALWMFAGICLAIEPPMPAARCSSDAFPMPGAKAAGPGGNHRFDLVIVEPKGRGPQGFRFQIVLDSATRGAESSLNLAAHAAGLIVTARDVDGIGNDLDLIIKSANSFTPIGIWLNNHHGGFTQADARIYAPSIWADGPLLLSASPTEVFQGAI